MTSPTRNVIKRSADNLNRLCGQQVSMTFGSDQKQYFCLCQGVSPGRFIMTQMPVDADIEKHLTPGNKAIVRFLDSGVVCGFKTKLNQAINNPFRLLFFDYPASLEVMNLRASRRVNIYLDATIEKGNESYHGSIRNLSAGGCFFVTDYWENTFLSNLSMEMELTISISLLSEEDPVTLTCKPVKVHRDKDEISMGLAFRNNQPEPVDRISTFVEHVSQMLGDDRGP